MRKKKSKLVYVNKFTGKVASSLDAAANPFLYALKRKRKK